MNKLQRPNLNYNNSDLADQKAARELTLASLSAMLAARGPARSPGLAISAFLTPALGACSRIVNPVAWIPGRAGLLRALAAGWP
jgi:hypothetical protein